MGTRHRYADEDYNGERPPLDREKQYSYRGGRFDGAIKQIGIAVIIAGILGFASLVFAVNGAISNLRETQGVQGKSIEFLQMQITEVKADQRIAEGKQLRGAAHDMGLDDAIKP